ncbi:hypothetical protein BH10ACI3_BH10ACI3_09710 [soil metagenome]
MNYDLPRNKVFRYGIAILAVAVALLITSQVDLLATQTPFPFFFAAVALATWFGGRSPGLVAIILSAVGADYFVITPRQFFIYDHIGTFQIVMFIAVALLLWWLTASHTDRKLIRESEGRYRDLFENAIDIIYTHDLEGNYTSVNKAVERIVGYTAEEVLTMNMASSVAPEYLEKARQMIAEKLAGMEITAYELEIIAKNGQSIPIEVNTRIIYENGVPVGVSGIARDITERMQTEEQLRESEQLLRESQRIAGLGSYVLDIAAGSWKSSDVLDEIFGIDEAYERSVEGWTDLIHPDDRKITFDYLNSKVLGGGHVFDKEYRIIRLNDQALRWVHGLGRLELDSRSQPVKMRGTIIDITERKRAEEDIQRRQTELLVLFDVMPAMIWFKDTENNILRVNKRVAEEAGLAVEEIEGKPSHEIYPDEAAKFYADDLKVINSGEPHLGYEEMLPGPDGEKRWVQTDKVPYFDNDGKPIGIVVMAQDITERKKIQEALGESEERYRDLVENAIDIIYTHDLDGNYTSANKAVEVVLGFTIDEVLTKNLSTTVTPEYLDIAKDMIAELLNRKESVISELEVFAKDGHRVAIEVKARLIKENGRPVGVQGIGRDISGRKQLEDQFRQAQKMESIGILAGGVAHDFNNLLTAINGYSDLTLRKLESDDPVRHNVQEIRDAGERAAALTAQLLAFSRKQILSPRVHNINTVITEIDKMLRRIMRENIDLHLVLDPKLGNIRADPGQIEQVIVNLAVNARDAMPNGGTLTIETENILLDDEYSDVHLTSAAGQFIRIAVSDTGLGMDESVKQRIFEPFFTTKEVGKGTGLGLSTVFGIVKQSGGNIRVYSEVGHGTTFKIYLPRVDDAVQKPRWRDEDDENLSGTETILLVEDEEAVRNLVREILTTNGYRVLEADSGEAALSICEGYFEPIHLLLSDVIMPGISGPVMKEQLIKLLPDIKVLFMSGYTDDSVAGKRILESGAAFIEKPFTPDALSRKIREVLES